jgi:hypothetical protein
MITICFLVTNSGFIIFIEHLLISDITAVICFRGVDGNCMNSYKMEKH